MCLCFFYLLVVARTFVVCFFFFNDTATTEIYTLSVHDALPISLQSEGVPVRVLISYGTHWFPWYMRRLAEHVPREDRKSTRLNSSHLVISYAVFCLKKKIQTDSILLFLV